MAFVRARVTGLARLVSFNSGWVDTSAEMRFSEGMSDRLRKEKGIVRTESRNDSRANRRRDASQRSIALTILAPVGMVLIAFGISRDPVVAMSMTTLGAAMLFLAVFGFRVIRLKIGAIEVELHRDEESYRAANHAVARGRRDARQPRATDMT